MTATTAPTALGYGADVPVTAAEDEAAAALARATVLGQPLAFIDTETTGIDPLKHDVWEVAVILRRPGTDHDAEHVRHLRPFLPNADPAALAVGRYHERAGTVAAWSRPRDVAVELGRLLDRAVILGAAPWFECGPGAFLWRLLRLHQVRVTWDYHLLDVPTYAAGQLGLEPPWSLDAVARRLGIDPAGYDRHTALGDARLVRQVWDTVRGGVR